MALNLFETEDSKNDHYHVIVQGIERFRVKFWQGTEPYLVAHIDREMTFRLVDRVKDAFSVSLHAGDSHAVYAN